MVRRWRLIGYFPILCHPLTLSQAADATLKHALEQHSKAAAAAADALAAASLADTAAALESIKVSFCHYCTGFPYQRLRIQGG